jgi:hypothetical protein
MKRPSTIMITRKITAAALITAICFATGSSLFAGDKAVAPAVGETAASSDAVKGKVSDAVKGVAKKAGSTVNSTSITPPVEAVPATDTLPADSAATTSASTDSK